MAATTVDEYIAGFPDDVQQILQKVRAAIHASVRSVDGHSGEEKMRYGIAAVSLGGRYYIHFAAWKKHLGLYPVPALSDELELRLKPYRSEKDSVVFKYNQPIPYDLIQDVAAAIFALRERSNSA
jgi:uncharacterized protein YdhG (YjbR/CyaY superfamily)